MAKTSKQRSVVTKAGRNSRTGRFAPVREFERRPTGTTQRERIPMPGRVVHRDATSGQFVMPAKNPRTGSYTTDRSTRDIKTGSSEFSSVLKRLAKR